jgi:hypothetical protein
MMHAITTAQGLRLAAEVVCDVRTIRRAYSGRSMTSTMLARITKCARDLGYPSPTSGAVAKSPTTRGAKTTKTRNPVGQRPTSGTQQESGVDKMIGYCRGSGLQMQHQEVVIRRWAEVYRVDLVRVVHDGTSARDVGDCPERTDLNEASSASLREAATAVASGLIVTDIGILASCNASRSLLAFLGEYPTERRLVCVAQRIDTDSPTGKWMLTTIIAALRAADSRQNERDALRALKESGACPNSVVCGGCGRIVSSRKDGHPRRHRDGAKICVGVDATGIRP